MFVSEGIIIAVKSITFENVRNAFWMESTTVGGSLVLLDSTMNSVTDAAIVVYNTAGATQEQDLLITLDNLVCDQAMTVVFDINAGAVLQTSAPGTVRSWIIGKEYNNNNPNGIWINGGTLDSLHPTTGSLFGGPNGGYFENSKPQYTTLASNYWYGLNDFTNTPVPGKSSSPSLLANTLTL
jgi:hypothetical protein